MLNHFEFKSFPSPYSHTVGEEHAYTKLAREL
jgi:hypothetical protein